MSRGHRLLAAVVGVVMLGGGYLGGYLGAQPPASGAERVADPENVTPLYTDDGTGAIVTVSYSHDDERAIEAVTVVVDGTQVPVDYLAER